jgi:integrase
LVKEILLSPTSQVLRPYREAEPRILKVLEKIDRMTCGTHSAHSLSQHGASIVYVKEQMGHSSIQVTVDTYGHLIPGAKVKWVDRLDSQTSPQQSIEGCTANH